MTEMQNGGGPVGSLPFVYGHVDPALLPAEQLQEAASEALRLHSQEALNYGAELGCRPLRHYLRAKLARDEGLILEPGALMLTPGASAGLDMAVRLFTQPGDAVLVEAPSYHEALAVIQDYPVELIPIPVEDDGVQVSALAERLEQLAGSKKRPRLLYSIPTFQNPSGVTLSTPKRLALLEIAHHYRLLIVEDDVYRDLYFEHPPPPSLFSLDTTQNYVIRLGSFSKILAPGLRLGWVMGGTKTIGRMAASGLTRSGGGANPFVAHTVAQFCSRGWLEPQINRLRGIYRERRNLVLAALRQHMPEGVSWTKPAGGFFVWLTLPDRLTARRVLASAEREGITFVPGDLFFVDDGGEQQIRLPFSYIKQSELTPGVEALAQVIRALLAQRRST